ncbi:MAG: acyl-CoA thioesterase [Actinobacteria bacterium]|nr:acyl-CoA thioesterase [Actinomycetota bacterium]MBT3688393.1 acyl-CoA thioesterase [Actinomycetota bacterium]MBT4037291.1 acyl-CoA thioesterase [Actinomycetota bacterium]MBT4278710.1 acyl-CoA thioesterase [Actinomycetota bacterium]MBT4343468.1 acyl-CoA thioesterase [Actinomycetota bacterium]
MPAHLHQVKVRFYELDPYGHLNHSVYVQLFETGRIELLAAVGLGLSDLDNRGYRFVVTNIETAFVKSVEAGDSIMVETEVVETRRASSIWRQRILRGDDVMATQQVRAAITDSNGRPTKAPGELAEALAPFTADSDT